MLSNLIFRRNDNGLLLLIVLFSCFRQFSLPLPIVFANGIALGRFIRTPVQGIEKYFPANGWINTYGLFGIKKWDGKNIYGQLFPSPNLLGVDFIGINGFTGLRIQKRYTLDSAYLGSALMVNISHNKPSFS